MGMLRKMFNQMLLICFGLLLWSGIYGILNHSETSRTLPWHFPLTCLLVGVLGALTQLIFFSRRDLSASELRTRTVLHVLVMIIILSTAGWLAGWYANIIENLLAILVFLIVYLFSWFSAMFSLWRDEKRINGALKKLHAREAGSTEENSTGERKPERRRNEERSIEERRNEERNIEGRGNEKHNIEGRDIEGRNIEKRNISVDPD